MAAKRWKIVDGVIEFDGVATISTNWPVLYGSYTPETFVELLNKVTVKGRAVKPSTRTHRWACAGPGRNAPGGCTYERGCDCWCHER